MTQPATPPAPPAPQTPPPGEPAATPPAAPAPAAPADKGAGGKDAVLADLAKERDARQALQKQVDALAPLQKLAEVLGVTPDKAKPTDIEALAGRLGSLEQRAADAEARAMRAEVAAAKKLPQSLADRLRGSTVEELAADADALLAAFPQPGQPSNGGTPQPDPTQGARGGSSDVQAALAEAQKKGDVREQIRLKTLLAEQAKK